MPRRLLLILTFGLSLWVPPLFAAQPHTLFNQELQLPTRSPSLILGASSNSPYALTLAQSVHSHFKLDTQTQLIPISQKNQNTMTAFRYQLTYRDVPVFEHEFILLVSEQGELIQSYGSIISNLDTDLEPFNPIAAYEIERIANNYVDTYKANSDVPVMVRNLTFRPTIFVTDDAIAHYTINIEFFSDTTQGNSQPKKIQTFIDLTNGEVLRESNTLAHEYIGGAGPGGNTSEVINDYVSSGADTVPPTTFIVDRQPEKNTFLCLFSADNVQTRNANHLTENLPTTPFQYNCTTSIVNEFKSINSAKSPINDAHFHAQVTSRLFETYLGEKPFLNQPIIQYVHYGNSVENAFYDNGEIYYGDGYNNFYPLVNINTVAHEIAHGFTNGIGTNNEKAMNYLQAKGLSEAFSDITGETAEFFLKGTNDWKVGPGATKDNSTRRYMDEPTRAGLSIDHIKDYYVGLDAHYSSGLFNKSFYHLSTNTTGASDAPWTIRYAFVAFAKANQLCWFANITFIEAADCVMQQSEFLSNQFDDAGIHHDNGMRWTSTELQNQIRKAFSQVGLDLVVGAEIESDFSLEQSFLSAQFINNTRNDGNLLTATDSEIGWSWLWDFGHDNATSDDFSPTHAFPESGKYIVKLTVTNPTGQTDTFQKTINLIADYCEITANGYYDENYLVGVTFDGHHQASGSTPYSDYSATPIEIKTGKKLAYILEAGYHDNTEKFQKRFYLWMDTNNDGFFNTTTELLVDDSDKMTLRGTLDFIGTPNKNYRIRVITGGQYDESPCSKNYTGEAEDYTIRWTDSAEDRFDIHPRQWQNLVQFIVTTNSPTIDHWLWTFGDGTQSTENNPTHAFVQSGTYTVKAIAYDSTNSILHTWEKPVTFASETTPEFKSEITHLSVKFSGYGKYPPNTEFLWNFGDDSTSTEKNPLHIYESDGEYTVTLMFKNTDNPEGVSIQKQIVLGNPVFIPNFTHTIQRKYNGEYDVLFDSAMSPPKNKKTGDWEYHWQFGDGAEYQSDETYLIGSNLHHYTSNGEFDAQLTIRYKRTTGLGENDWEWTSATHRETVSLNIDAENDYCEAIGDTDNEYVRVVEINNQRFETGDNGGLVNPDSPIQLFAGANTYYIEAGYPGDIKRSERYQAWVDINKDYLFTDENTDENIDEEIINILDHDSDSAFYGNGFVQGTFYLPIENSNAGTTYSTLRLSQFFTFPRDILKRQSPCIRRNSNGEMEDYRVSWTIIPTLDIQPQMDGNTLLLINSTQKSDSLQWRWDFGDGTSSQERSPSHSFNENGQYVVKLTALDHEEKELTTWQQTIDFNSVTLPVLVTSVSGKTLTFDASNSQYPDGSTLQIDFGDGTTSTDTVGKHTYAQHDEYHVVLKIKNTDYPDGVIKTVTVKTQQNKGGSFGFTEILLLFLLWFTGALGKTKKTESK